MQRKKRVAVMKFLNDEKLHHNINLVVEHLGDKDYLIRASYDEHLDLDKSTLARIMAVDVVYLLNYINHHQAESSADNTNPEMMKMKKKLAAEILMLENQIPVNFLLEIRGILKWSDDHALTENVRSFCKKESPLELTEKPVVHILRLMTSSQGHLLNVMYNLILPDESESEDDSKLPMARSTGRRRTAEKLKQAAEIAAAIGFPGAAIVQKELSVIQKVPWEVMLDKSKKVDPDREENSLVDEIRIPSVSQLTRIADIVFELTAGGIRNVEFKQGEKNKLCLPTITLHSNSEVVLRNLLAYEAATTKPGSTLELAEYVDLMCGIVDTPEDIEILRKAEIIVGDLKPEEIVGIFNGIRRSTGDKYADKSYIGKAVEQVKELYGNTTRVKVTRFIKKYSHISWQFLAILSSVLLLMLLALQAFCIINDCNKHWLSIKNKYNHLPLQVF